MFHSAGYFRAVPCPFFEHGLCHRPHCHYKHNKPKSSKPATKPVLRILPRLNLPQTLVDKVTLANKPEEKQDKPNKETGSRAASPGTIEETGSTAIGVDSVPGAVVPVDGAVVPADGDGGSLMKAIPQVVEAIGQISNYFGSSSTGHSTEHPNEISGQLCSEVKAHELAVDVGLDEGGLRTVESGDGSAELDTHQVTPQLGNTTIGQLSRESIGRLAGELAVQLVGNAKGESVEDGNSSQVPIYAPEKCIASENEYATKRDEKVSPEELTSVPTLGTGRGGGDSADVSKLESMLVSEKDIFGVPLPEYEDSSDGGDVDDGKYKLCEEAAGDGSGETYGPTGQSVCHRTGQDVCGPIGQDVCPNLNLVSGDGDSFNDDIEGDTHIVGGGDGKKEPGKEDMSLSQQDMMAEFQKITSLQEQVHSNSSLINARKRNHPADDKKDMDIPVKKKRVAYSQAENVGVRDPVRVEPSRNKPVDPNFSSMLKQGNLYMGKKRTANKESAPTAVKRPRLALNPNAKIATKVRQKYLDAYIDEHMKMNVPPQDAYQKALEEEKLQFDDNHASRNSYLNKSYQALKQLRAKVESYVAKQKQESDKRVQESKNISTDDLIRGSKSIKLKPVRKDMANKSSKSVSASGKKGRRDWESLDADLQASFSRVQAKVVKKPQDLGNTQSKADVGVSQSRSLKASGEESGTFIKRKSKPPAGVKHLKGSEPPSGRRSSGSEPPRLSPTGSAAVKLSSGFDEALGMIDAGLKSSSFYSNKKQERTRPETLLHKTMEGSKAMVDSGKIKSSYADGGKSKSSLGMAGASLNSSKKKQEKPRPEIQIHKKMEGSKTKMDGGKSKSSGNSSADGGNWKVSSADGSKGKIGKEKMSSADGSKRKVSSADGRKGKMSSDGGKHTDDGMGKVDGSMGKMSGDGGKGTMDGSKGEVSNDGGMGRVEDSNGKKSSTDGGKGKVSSDGGMGKVDGGKEKVSIGTSAHNKWTVVNGGKGHVIKSNVGGGKSKPESMKAKQTCLKSVLDCIKATTQSSRTPQESKSYSSGLDLTVCSEQTGSYEAEQKELEVGGRKSQSRGAASRLILSTTKLKLNKDAKGSHTSRVVYKEVGGDSRERADICRHMESEDSDSADDTELLVSGLLKRKQTPVVISPDADLIAKKYGEPSRANTSPPLHYDSSSDVNLDTSPCRGSGKVGESEDSSLVDLTCELFGSDSEDSVVIFSKPPSPVRPALLVLAPPSEVPSITVSPTNISPTWGDLSGPPTPPTCDLDLPHLSPLPTIILSTDDEDSNDDGDELQTFSFETALSSVEKSRLKRRSGKHTAKKNAYKMSNNKRSRPLKEREKTDVQVRDVEDKGEVRSPLKDVDDDKVTLLTSTGSSSQFQLFNKIPSLKLIKARLNSTRSNLSPVTGDSSYSPSVTTTNRPRSSSIILAESDSDTSDIVSSHIGKTDRLAVMGQHKRKIGGGGPCSSNILADSDLDVSDIPSHIGERNRLADQHKRKKIGGDGGPCSSNILADSDSDTSDIPSHIGERNRLADVGQHKQKKGGGKARKTSSSNLSDFDTHRKGGKIAEAQTHGSSEALAHQPCGPFISLAKTALQYKSVPMSSSHHLKKPVGSTSLVKKKGVKLAGTIKHRREEDRSSRARKTGGGQARREGKEGGGTRNTQNFAILKKKTVPPLTSELFYSQMWSYLMTEDQLVGNGYPRPTSERGVASIKKREGEVPTKVEAIGPNAMRHECCRCRKPFIIYNNGQYQTVESCSYHYGRAYKYKEYGEGVVSKYSCCQERSGSPGCQLAKLHVTAGEALSREPGYVRTKPPPDAATCSAQHHQQVVYALDCEMCYTTVGLQLTRVSVVDMTLKPVYETLVKPSHTIVDYNTRFSGLMAQDFVGLETTLTQVQQQLLDLFSSETILVGHSLESDLKTLKLLHSRVVDTALVFPHKLGLPYKKALKTLAKDILHKFIQNDIDNGHDSLEDSRACMELMLWKVKSDLKAMCRRTSIS